MMNINLLPWRMQKRLMRHKKWQQIWRAVIVLGLFLLCCEILFLVYFQQKSASLMREAVEVQTSESISGDDQVLVATQMTKKLNDFLTLCQKISASEHDHVQLIKMNFADKKIVMAGTANSIADLSAWVKALNSQGLHVFVQQLSKSMRNDQFHFLVLI